MSKVILAFALCAAFGGTSFARSTPVPSGVPRAADVADLAVRKIGPVTVTAGGDSSYTIALSSNGPSSTTAVVVDTLPPNTTFLTLIVSPAGVFDCSIPAPGNHGTVTCNVLQIAPGETPFFQIVFRLAADVPRGSTVTNSATITGAAIDPDATNNTASTSAIVVKEADVSVLKNIIANVAAGGLATCTIDVANAGPDPSSVTMRDVLPAELSFVSLTQTSGPAFDCTTPVVGASGTINCTITLLGAGSAASFSLVTAVSPYASGNLANTAVVFTSTPDPFPVNNTSTANAVVIPTDEIPALPPAQLALLAVVLSAVAAFKLRKS